MVSTTAARLAWSMLASRMAKAAVSIGLAKSAAMSIGVVCYNGALRLKSSRLMLEISSRICLSCW